MASLADLLLPQGAATTLPPSLAECLDTLARAAAALQLADTRPASLAAAARQAAAAAQEAQDREVCCRRGRGRAAAGCSRA